MLKAWHINAYTQTLHDTYSKLYINIVGYSPGQYPGSYLGEIEPLAGLTLSLPVNDLSRHRVTKDAEGIITVLS